MTETRADARNQRLANALRTLIAAVKREAHPSIVSEQPLSSELIADSYYEQSLGGPNALDNAFERAQRAATNSPDFGFAWARVAELEFSFGRRNRAQADLKRALRLSPRNAQALALQGFVLAAQNRMRDAIASFDDALAVDSGLGNAWLGRGLCRIHQGDTQAGREDLLIAAAMEPQRAVLRSYLGKALGDAGETRRAHHELNLAKQLDPNDPTAWLYSALMNEQNYRINEAVRDLQESQDLNDNRSVFRSSMLLDQDRAVRSANLARIYQEAGLDDIAVDEAAKSVSANYQNYSAHLFLANSYEQVLESSPYNLRYETPAFSEYLIASLMGPVNGQLLAQPVTQQEYTQLFDKDSFGASSSTEYLSRGAFDQYLAQYGTLRNTSYALEGEYNWDPGQTPNGSQQTVDLSFKLKQMLTPDDGLFFQISGFQQDSGDLSQRYDPNQADLDYKATEKQQPAILVGLDHRWSETQRTLFLASIYNDTVSVTDSNGPTYLLGSVANGTPPFEFEPFNLTEQFGNRLLLKSFELQHLATFSELQLIGGIRFQSGNYRLENEQSWFHNNWLDADPIDRFLFPDPPATLANQYLLADSLRVSPYLNGYWHVVKQLCLIGGLSYDYQSLPENTLFAPLDSQTKIQKQFSPKAGLVWTPDSRTTIRGAYAKSLSGDNLDQSLRLEPSEIAGFPTTFREVMPSSLVGGIGGESVETADVSLQRRFGSGTYISVSAGYLHSAADQSVGAFAQVLLSGEGFPIQEERQLALQERWLDFSVHQLLGNYFSVGANYRVSQDQLNSTFPQLDPFLREEADSAIEGKLAVLSLDGLFQLPCGVFASMQGQWWQQSLSQDLSNVPGDNFWQLNAEIGYRSPRRRVQVSVGLLNITGQDYRLHPINLYPDLQRERTLAIKLQLNF